DNHSLHYALPISRRCARHTNKSGALGAACGPSGGRRKARDAFEDDMTPEGRVKEKVKALLRRYGAYYFMPVQYGYGAPSVDFLVCHQGFFAAIETKAEGKKPTKRQALVLQEI